MIGWDVPVQRTPPRMVRAPREFDAPQEAPLAGTRLLARVPDGFRVRGELFCRSQKNELARRPLEWRSNWTCLVT